MDTTLSHTLITKSASRTTLHWLQSLPTPLEEKNLGKLFGILEIDSNSQSNDQILNTVGEEFHQAFYSSDHFTTEAAFEVALQKTNKKIQEISHSLGEEWLEHFSAILGVIHNEQVFFSHVGTIVGLLLYKDSLSELIDQTRAKQEVVSPVKVFQHTVAGAIQKDTQIFFATESLYDYFSQEKIRRLLTTEAPDTVSEHIQSMLSEDAHTSLACAILAPEYSTKPQPQFAEAIASTRSSAPLDSDSMSTLLTRENQTSETLSGSLWSNIKSSLQTNSRTQGKQPLARMIASRIMQGALLLGKMLVQVTMALGGMIMNLISKKNTSFSPRLSTKSRRSPWSFITKALGSVWQWFKRLTAVQKSFVLVITVVCLILVQSVLSKNTEQVTDTKKTEYTAALSNADLKINEAKAAMLYDKNRARTLLNEATALVNAIPSDAKDFTQGVADRKNAIKEQVLIANNVTVLNDPEKVLEFGPLSSSANITSISLLGSSIYAFDATAGRVYRGNLDTKEETITINQSPQEVKTVSKASLGTVLTVLSNNTVGIFNPVSESIKALTVEFANQDRTLTDARLFASRLYTLDTKNNQIFKHTKNSDTNYAKGVAWITDGTSVADATGFAIDGSIYVLRSGGEVIKLSGGKKDSWSVNTVDPVLSSGNALFTDENTTHLYILDSNNQRVLVYGKDGTLTSQFQSSAFANAKDIAVDESKKVLYVASDNNIYTVTLP